MKCLLSTCIVLLTTYCTVVAQRDPANEILVYFKEGISREKTDNGSQTLRQTVKSGELKAKLTSLGISDDMLEPALPKFNEIDTLTTLSDGTLVTRLNMAKLCRIKVKPGQSREALIEELKKLKEVLYAEPNGTVTHFATPSDTQFNQQWSLINTINFGEDIHATAAWEIYTGNPNNIIAVVDGGIDKTHSDLNDKVAGGDNGYGWGGHGVHVAGIAAAESNNAQGISGVDWNAKIHSQRIDNASDDEATYDAIVNAVNYSPNVFVINHSWGLTSGNDSYGRPLVGRNSITVREAFAYAYKLNRTSVVAMGNHQEYQQNVVSYPAGYDKVIAVGSTGVSGIIANSSGQGTHIDVAAPGVNIWSTLGGSTYGSLSGTSMAAPHVSGIASLMKGYKPNLSNDDIENIIKLSVDDKGAVGFDNAYGYGRVNAEKALNYLRAPYTLSQETSTGGTVYSTTNSYGQTFIAAAPALTTGNYTVKRKEVRKVVTFSTPVCQLVGAWGRGVGSSGWSPANPNYGEGFVEIVPGTLTNTGATLRTYVYEVFTISGQQLGHYPASPANVIFKYSVLGIADPNPNKSISGTSLVCDSNSTFILNNVNQGTVSWQATPSYHFTTSSGIGSIAVLKASSATTSGPGTLTYSIMDSVGCQVVTISKTFWVGLPSTNISAVYNSSHNWVTFDPASPSTGATYSWVIDGVTYPYGNAIHPLPACGGSPYITTYTFEATLTATNSCGTSTRCQQFKFTCVPSKTFTSLGICGAVDPPPCDPSIVAYEVSPNPANSQINVAIIPPCESITAGNSANGRISSPDEGENKSQEDVGTQSVVLYDLQGQKRYSEVFTNKKNFNIDVSSLSQGIYILRISTDKQIEQRRIVISK